MKNKILVLFLLVVMILPMFNFVKADTTLKSKYAIDDLKEYFKANKTFDVVNLASKEREKINLPENINFDTLFKDTYVNFHDYFILYDKKTNIIHILFNNVSDNTSFNYKIGDYFYFNNSPEIGYFYDRVSFNLNNKEYLYFRNTSPNSWNLFDLSDYYICSNTNFYFISDGNYDLWYSPDDTIGDPSSDLQLSYEYNEENTSCHINATLKGGEFTDQIYYSNYQFDLEGKLKTKKPFPKAGIDITENQALYFQAEDKDGNIKAKNTMNIYGIGKLDPNNFIVNIDTSSQSAVIFSAKLLNDGYIYNSINCKISDTENLGILKGLSYMTSDFKEYNEIGQNEEYKIKNFSNDRKKITLYFQIKNKVTGKVMLTKSYDIDLKSTITESDFSTIDSGIINEGQDDEQIMTPDNDPNFGKNNGSLDFDWNFDTAKNSIEEFFTTAKEMFNLIINFLNQLPRWITIPLYTLFMMAIIIFVYHVIRG